MPSAVSHRMSPLLNENGHPMTLQPSHPGNQNRLAHGAYSSNPDLSPRASEVADALMSLPHVAALDRLAAEEIGRLAALLERVDADLADRGLTRKNGEARTLGTDREPERLAFGGPARRPHVVAARQLARELGDDAERVARHDGDLDPAADEREDRLKRVFVIERRSLVSDQPARPHASPP